MTKQDLWTKSNPYTANFLRAHGVYDDYLVQSASSEDVYVTSIHRDDPELDRCSCPARVPCNHMHRARLRRDLERVECNSHALYRDWGLVELANEDARLREELAAADSWLTRSQLGVVGTLIGAYFAAGAEVA